MSPLTLPPAQADEIEEVIDLGADEVVRQLSAALSRAIVALVAGVSETKLVGKWERGAVTPQHDRELALKTALQIVRILQPRYRNRSIVTWLCGVNPRLDGTSPAEILSALATHYDPENVRRILNAATAFATR
ncbi:MAG TPA: hypothetical protein VJP85_13865 [Candidatus Baltobacteraceae bacterium]|nr:hypothetical protein [Candidatus Baltobacteraceae bacterium]